MNRILASRVSACVSEEFQTFLHSSMIRQVWYDLSSPWSCLSVGLLLLVGWSSLIVLGCDWAIHESRWVLMIQQARHAPLKETVLCTSRFWLDHLTCDDLCWQCEVDIFNLCVWMISWLWQCQRKKLYQDPTACRWIHVKFFVRRKGMSLGSTGSWSYERSFLGRLLIVRFSILGLVCWLRCSSI